MKQVEADSETARGTRRRRGAGFLALSAVGVVLGFGLLSLLSAAPEDDSQSDQGVFEEPDDLAVPSIPLPSSTTQTTTSTNATSKSSEVLFAEVEWTIDLNDPEAGPGVHTIFTIAEARPLTEDAIEDLFGFLVWDGETVVDLCGVAVRQFGIGYVHIGDGYQTTEGCGANPNAMQEAVDRFGPPDMACVGVRTSGASYKYCASLNESQTDSAFRPRSMNRK